MPKPIPRIWAVSLCIGSALLLMLAFPYTRLTWLSLVALVPYMLAIRAQGFWRGLSLGWLHGFVFQSYIMFWANFFGPPAYLFLALYKTLLPALFGGCWGWLSRHRPQWFGLSFVAGWVALEYTQTFGPFGTTWGSLSHAWARFPVLIQCASLAGCWLLTALLATTGVTLYQWLQKGPWKTWLGASLLGWAGCLSFGYWKLKQPLQGPSIVAASVQVSMSRETKWDPAFARLALDSLERLSCQAAQAGAKLILWPETAIPFRGFLSNPQLTFEIGMLGRTTQAYLVVGSIEKLGDEANHTRNAASLVTPEGAFAGRYDKQRLVPGGEYLPFEAQLRKYRIFDRVMRFLPGQPSPLFDCSQLNAKAGMLICFESMVPYLAAERVSQGANLLLVATNDGWFGANSAIYHHFEMAIFRAVEQGRSVVHCGNTGISGIIDPLGRVLRETPINQEALVIGPTTLASQTTLYQRLGDWFPRLCSAFFFLSLLGAKVSLPSTRN